MVRFTQNLVQRLRQNLSFILLLAAILVAIVAQVVMTGFSLEQIRHEELSESVRNVYWLKHRQIYDGISSNVGWYGSLLIIYELFGFSIHTAKAFRLVLHVGSVSSLGVILYFFLKIRSAWLLVLLYALSPTLLFFNTLQTSYGIDLQLTPIIACLLFIFTRVKKYWLKAIGLFATSALVMLAAMSYATSLAYIPILTVVLIVLLWQMAELTLSKKLQLLAWIIAGFILPLALALFWLKRPELLIYDPQVGSGIFRGGGISNQASSPLTVLKYIKAGSKISLYDLFISPSSYYYELLRSDFSHFLLHIDLVALIVIALILIRQKSLFKIRLAILTGGSLIFIGLLVGSVSNWLPGIRRSTPGLVGLFIVMASVWKGSLLLAKSQLVWQRVVSYVGLSAVCIPLIFWVRFFPQNLQGLKFPSPNQADACFHLAGQWPSQSLNNYLNQLQEVRPQPEPVIISNAKIKNCRLHELYPLLKGACAWNNLNCADFVFAPSHEFKQPDHFED
jgi:hypothetical protein